MATLEEAETALADEVAFLLERVCKLEETPNENSVPLLGSTPCFDKQDVKCMTEPSIIRVQGLGVSGGQKEDGCRAVRTKVGDCNLGARRKQKHDIQKNIVVEKKKSNTRERSSLAHAPATAGLHQSWVACSSQASEGNKVKSSVWDKACKKHDRKHASQLENRRALSTAEKSSCPPSENSLNAKLSQLHCHFTWGLKHDERYSPENLIKTLELKDKDIHCGQRNVITEVAITALLSYEHARAKNYDKALGFIEEVLFLAQEKTVNAQRGGLLYVAEGDKAHVLQCAGREDEAKQLLNDIREYKDLKPKEEAAVFAVCATAHLEHGLDGFSRAKTAATQAVKLDNECADWHFLLGKCLARIRRVEARFSTPSGEEICELETAVRYCDVAGYKVFLAQTLQEKAHSLFTYYKRMGQLEKVRVSIKKLNERAYHMYNQAVGQDPVNPKLNIRCADGFSKLPVPFRDLTVAENCYWKALELSPENSMINHKVGKFFVVMKKDYKRGLYHLEKAENTVEGNFGAAMDICRYNSHLDHEFDPTGKFDQMLQKYKEKVHQVEIYCQRGSYYFHKRNDLEAACCDWLKAMKISPEDKHILDHYCMWVTGLCVNLYGFLFKELKKAVAVEVNEEKVTYYRQSLVTLEKMSPFVLELEKISPVLQLHDPGTV